MKIYIFLIFCLGVCVFSGCATAVYGTTEDITIHMSDSQKKTRASVKKIENSVEIVDEIPKSNNSFTVEISTRTQSQITLTEPGYEPLVLHFVPMRSSWRVFWTGLVTGGMSYMFEHDNGALNVFEKTHFEDVMLIPQPTEKRTVVPLENVNQVQDSNPDSNPGLKNDLEKELLKEKLYNQYLEEQLQKKSSK